jgi:elongation factor 1-beta
MGEVLCILKVMPTGVSVDMGKLKSRIQKLGPKAIEIVPIAFGLKALDVRFIRQDSEGGTEDLEEKIRKIEGVESVETTGVTLIS